MNEHELQRERFACTNLLASESASDKAREWACDRLAQIDADPSIPPTSYGQHSRYASLADTLEPTPVPGVTCNHPRPWWYRLALKLCPGRCREIPEANNPTWADGSPRLVLRQVALIKNRRELQLRALLGLAAATWRTRWLWRALFAVASFANLYLQQFAAEEDSRFLHSHPYKFMLAIGLWGGYTERRIAGAGPRRRSAPYLFAMDGSHVHHVQAPSRSHTSLFLGLVRAIDGSEGDKKYFGVPVLGAADGLGPETRTSTWQDHIKVKVARI